LICLGLEPIDIHFEERKLEKKEGQHHRRHDALKKGFLQVNTPKMPEPCTPNKPYSSTKEAPYQIDNIQILSTAADTCRSSAG
jgi:hypothetical protein